MLKKSTALANAVNTFFMTIAANQINDISATQMRCSSGKSVELGSAN